MGGKIVFGSILSALMLITVAFIAPVQVKANDMQTAEKIKEKIEEIGQRLDNDNKITQLIQLHQSQEIEDIFIAVLESNSEDEINNLADDYINLIGKDQLNLLLTDIDQEYNTGFISVITSLTNLFGNKNSKSSSDIFRVEQVDGKLKIIKLEEIKLKENTLIFTGEGNIIFPNGRTVTQIDWGKLADFCTALSNIGLAIEIAGLIIEYIGIILVFLGFAELGDFLVNAGFALGMAGFIFGMIFLILSEFFRSLAEDEKSRNHNNKLLTLIENIRMKIQIILQRFYHKLAC